MVLDEILQVTGKSFEEQYKSIITHIDKRTRDYRKLLLRIVNTHISDPQKLEEAESLLKEGLRILFLYDYYSETEDRRYLVSGWSLEENLYSRLSPEHKFEQIEIREKIAPFFYVEKKVWNSAKSGKSISNDEFNEFWWRKASDALFYAGLMKPFTENRDYGRPLHVYTQLLDGVLDITEYEKDLAKRLPNILYIKLANPVIAVPNIMADAIRQLREQEKHQGILDTADRRIAELSDFDFTNCEFLHDRIMQQKNSLRKLLCGQ